MTVVLTLADITEHPPPLGSVIRIAPREFVVFARHTNDTSCRDCAFIDDNPRCKAAKCFGGIYIPKNKYLEMRLLGEL